MAIPEAKIFVAPPPRRRWPAVVAGLMLLVIVALLLASRFRTNSAVSTVGPTPPPITAPLTPVANSNKATKAPEPTRDPREILNAVKERLLLHLPFSSSLNDHSRHTREIENPGTIEVHDGAAHFPGDAYLTLPHIPLDNRPFSFAVWIKPEGKIVGYGLLEQNGGGPGKLLHLLMRDPDRPYLGFYLNDLRAPQSVQPEVWTHLAFQFTGSHQQIWINGQLATERVADAFQGESGATLIGKAPVWNNISTRCFTGAMRDLRLYDAALTPQQIRVLAGLDPNPDKKPGDVF